jgi:hypothetical protein
MRPISGCAIASLNSRTAVTGSDAVEKPRRMTPRAPIHRSLSRFDQRGGGRRILSRSPVLLVNTTGRRGKNSRFRPCGFGHA